MRVRGLLSDSCAPLRAESTPALLNPTCSDCLTASTNAAPRSSPLSWSEPLTAALMLMIRPSPYFAPPESWQLNSFWPLDSTAMLPCTPMVISSPGTVATGNATLRVTLAKLPVLIPEAIERTRVESASNEPADAV